MAEDGELARLIWNVAHLTGTFVLRAGGVTNEYFDKYRFEADPELLARVVSGLEPMLPAEELVAGLETGGIPLAALLSARSGRSLRFVRKAAKPYGTRQQVEGGDVNGRTVTVIEDVATSGRSIVDGVSALRAQGARVGYALCVVDREDGASAALAAVDVELRALFSVTQLRAAAGQDA